MEQMLGFIQKYGVNVVVIALLMVIILWFMHITNKYLDGIDKRFDSLERTMSESVGSQKAIVEFIKAAMFGSRNNGQNNGGGGAGDE